MKRASKRLDSLVGDHTITCVAIGDGTNTRGAQRLVASTPKLATVPRAVVRECGASVYSASDSAAKEFGENVPLSARGAASLARRLLDPLGGLPASGSLYVSRRWRLPSTPSSSALTARGLRCILKHSIASCMSGTSRRRKQSCSKPALSARSYQFFGMISGIGQRSCASCGP